MINPDLDLADLYQGVRTDNRALLEMEDRAREASGTDEIPVETGWVVAVSPSEQIAELV